MSDVTPSAPVPRGHVISQEETSGKDSTGKYVQGVNVTAQLEGTGTAFTVFVPQSQYTPANVQAALEAKAAQVGAVNGITFGG